MSLQPPATTNETVEARLRLVEEREAHATKIEAKMAEMEREHAAMLEKKKAAEAKVGPYGRLAVHVSNVWSHGPLMAHVVIEVRWANT